MDFQLPDLSNLINLPPILPNITDYKTQRVVSAIDNIQNINRLRDMDNLSYQIKLKEQQKQIYQRKLDSIVSTLDMKIGIIMSILIIIFSVLIPFLGVSFQNYLEQYKNYVFIYLIITFIISMMSMLLYLIWFWKK
jgi:Mg2+ and Co2+ transporter CorA